MRSRLTERIENKTKQNIIFSVIGILIILGLLWKFGVPLFATASFMLAGSKNDDTVEKKTGYIAPPVLNATYDATNSAQVTISGSSLSDASIELFVNNAKKDTTSVDSDHSFSFTSIPLHSGENSIKARVNDNGQKSNFSNILTITYLNQPAQLSIDTPSDGAQFHKDDKKAEVKGKTDPGTKVTVNDFWAIVDTDGNYSYTVALKDGDNDIKVIATDAAGNKTEKQIKITYSP
jgi:bacillopeptidase F